MSITLSPSKAAYLTRVAEGLSDLPEEDREEVLQDLEAHLSELSDDDLESTLGMPEGFVLEFRRSAGLAEPEPAASPGVIERIRARLDAWSSRLSEIVRWPTIRPLWVWTRGWILVTTWSLLYYQDQFLHFPIPNVGSSSLTGLTLAAAATWLSMWLDQSEEPHLKAVGSLIFSMAAGIGLAVSLGATPAPHVEFVEVDEFDQLVGADGTPVENVYVYDLEGNPMEALLFDQEGRPLLSLPPYVYDEAEYDPARESIDFGNGTVTFPRDQFGRIIPNLYPLDMSVYDEYGRLVPMPSPSSGFPTVGAEEMPIDNGVVPTTISSVR